MKSLYNNPEESSMSKFGIAENVVQLLKRITKQLKKTKKNLSGSNPRLSPTQLYKYSRK
jgi:hypothetical protein